MITSLDLYLFTLIDEFRYISVMPEVRVEDISVMPEVRVEDRQL